MRKPRNFSPGDKVIRFDRERPRLAWVVSGRKLGHISAVDNSVDVIVSCHEDEAALGLGDFVRIEKVAPYSDVFWNSCELWISEVERLEKAYDGLKKGRVFTLRQPSFFD